MFIFHLYLFFPHRRSLSFFQNAIAAATCLQKYKKYLIPYYIYEKNLHFMIKTSLFLWRFRTISVLLHFRINNSTD
ncbi:hypothetical protein PREVCOP_05056 [Segatella copri DSM 18205]|uniref:Uncharacterized protein n=1 Tax=Segatella copri DSM 18205 TaxID=537011 RepID=D1PCX0_9BACT|nr:hypothetical protein PREVCOP_05056 [Segatella copri DSM 18205]